MGADDDRLMPMRLLSPWWLVWLAWICCWHGVDAEKPVGTVLVFGLGLGLVAVVILALVCVLICVLGYSAQNKVPFLVPVVAIVGVTSLFFASVTFENPSASAQTAMRYNRVAITRSAVATIMIAFTVISCFSVLIMHVIQHRQGHLIGDRVGRRRGHARVF